jgi:hypothetical protein
MSPARPVRKDRFRLIDTCTCCTCDATAHVDAPHLDRGPDAQARARHGRLLRGAAAARLARPRGAHGLLAATSLDAIVLGGAPAAARRPAHDVLPLRRQGSRHLRPRPQQVARARRRPPRLAGDAAQRSAESRRPTTARRLRPPPPCPSRTHRAHTHGPKRPMAATNAAIQNSMQQLAATTRPRGSA